MKETFEKIEAIDAFSIDLDGLEGFVVKLRQEFDKKDDVSVSIEFNISESTLKFDSIEDVRQSKISCANVNNFRIHMFSGDKSMAFWNRPPGGIGRSYMRSTCSRISWCIGVNGVASRYLRQHRVWYHLMFRAYFWWIVGPLALVASDYSIKSYPYATSAVFLGLIALFFAKEFVFPCGVIKIDQAQRSLDITAIATTVVAIAAVATLLLDIFYLN